MLDLVRREIIAGEPQGPRLGRGSAEKDRGSEGKGQAGDGKQHASCGHQRRSDNAMFMDEYKS